MDTHSGVFNLTKYSRSQIEFENPLILRSDVLGVITGTSLVYLLNLNSKNIQEKKQSSIIFITYGILTLLLSLILIIILTAFLIYRAFIYATLKIKYRSKFIGFLKGPDAFWQLRDDSSSSISVLMIVKWKQRNNIRDVFMEKLHAKLCKKDEYKKLFCRTSKCLGYSYLIKGESDLRRYVKIVDHEKYSNRYQLESTLNELASTDIKETLWEILIGERQINLGNKTGNPIFIRFDHCLGDGVCLLQLLLACFADIEPEDSAPERDEFMQTLVKISIYCMHFILVLYNLPSLIFERLSKAPDKNAIHGPRLSGKKVLAWKTEDCGKYVKTVKTIKKEFYVGFFDVVATALAAAINELLKQYSNKVTDVTSVIPAFPNIMCFKDLHRLKRVDMTNNFSVGLLELPLKKNKLEKYSTLERFQQIKRKVFALKNSLQYQLNYWLLNIIATLTPESILRPLLYSTQSTMIVSNLPGPKKLNILKENSLEEIIFWVPHRGFTGVSFSIFTYENRFQIGVSIDEVYGISRESIKKVLVDFFKHLDILEYEVTR